MPGVLALGFRDLDRIVIRLPKEKVAVLEGPAVTGPDPEVRDVGHTVERGIGLPVPRPGAAVVLTALVDHHGVVPRRRGLPGACGPSRAAVVRLAEQLLALGKERDVEAVSFPRASIAPLSWTRS